MSNPAYVVTPPTERREQPFLYTWNRRLRHLHGVSLRNLNINPPHGRSRGKTIADDDYDLQSPAKKFIRDEARKLHHAKSYDQLLKANHDHDSPQSPSRASTANERASGGPARPARGKMRRRSTLHWASSNPQARQLKLEAVEMNRLVTSWFSIHYQDFEQPIYISEVMERSMNPSFSFFDLDTSLANVARSDNFTIRIWSKNEHMDEYRTLVELNVSMGSLQFIGKTLENFHHPLPENCVLFHLSDGIYTSFTDLPAESKQQPPLTQAMKSLPPTSVASFDTLLKLANLDEVIQDALKTRSKLESEINEILAHMPPSEEALSQLSLQQDQNKNVKRAVDAERKQIETIRKTTDQLRSSLYSRREVIKDLATDETMAEDRRKGLVNCTQKVHRELDSLGDSSQAQIRRICAGVLQIYPIEPVKNKALQFAIRNIHLPNSSFNDTNSDQIAAALGYTAQLIYQLSLYLSIPLPYRIEPNLSNTVIHDDVSAGIAQRRFPLHPSGPVYKFEYGVFLLNKDIEFLMNRSGLRVMDIRHTLPNLKYLMFVLTAGSGELPSRKAGGIRGLLRGRMTPSISRRGSDESVLSQASIALSDGKLAEKEKMGDADDVFNGPVRARGLPYRKSMLRDSG